MRFEWDEKKNRSNRKKHGVWFEEAQQVFDDASALRFYDPEHSKDEDRFILLGMSGPGRLLVVVYCERDSDSIIRIISARKATKRESKDYEKGI
ncbi:MAG: BrnT family toxin [Bdellovibrionales bacterium]|nr:BrnT family toxin [Bdellovibrionales bacterium]